MSNWGLKTSRIGYDVNTASDKQLSFSSEWPLLPIEAEGDITIEAPEGGGAVSQDIYIHGLDYIPVFYIHRTGGGLFYPSWCSITDEKLAFSGNCDEDINLKWKVFRRPLETNFVADSSSAVDATQVTDSDYGLLVSLNGKDISSIDKRDFCVRSDCRQLMIAQSGYEFSPASLSVTHDLGYKPMFWVFGKVGTAYIFISQGASTGIEATTTTLTVEDYGASIGDWAYIIFKDTLDTDG